MRIFVIITLAFFLFAGTAGAQEPTPTSTYYLIEGAQEITYTSWASASTYDMGITQTLTLPIDYRQIASYALTAYDFFANVSYLAYILPFVIAMKMLHWLFKYVFGFRIDRNRQHEIEISDWLGAGAADDQ